MDSGIQTASFLASSWETRGYWASVVVTTGVALEFWEIFLAIRAGDGRKKIVETTAIVLLVLGLIGEIWTAVEANKYNGLEVADAQSKAADAQIKAAAALHDAVSAEDTTKKAMQKIIALEKNEEPRFFKPDQDDEIFNKLNAFSGQPFKTFWAASDSETRGFALDVNITIGGAGWHQQDVEPEPLLSMLIGTIPPPGINIWVNQKEPSGDSTWVAANALAKILQADGFSRSSVASNIAPDPDMGVVSVVVGEKPQLMPDDLDKSLDQSGQENAQNKQ